MTELISSAANPVVKRMRLLGDRKHRRREGAFVVEGIQPVWQAVEAGAEVEVLVVAPDLLGSRTAGMVAAQEAAGVRVARLTGELFARVSARDGPSGLAAIVRGRIPGLASLPVTPAAVFVALHEIGNPGNLGTIIRTADAAGGSGVVLIGAAADPFDPAAVKASMGALFAVPVARVAAIAELPRPLVALVAGAGEPLAPADAGTLLIGAERAGLPPEVVEGCDRVRHIPIRSESLNAAMAATVAMYEVTRDA